VNEKMEEIGSSERFLLAYSQKRKRRGKKKVVIKKLYSVENWINFSISLLLWRLILKNPNLFRLVPSNG